MKNNKTWMLLILPILISILMYLFLIKINTQPAWVLEFTPWAPYLILLLAGFLAYRFNQSKIFYLAVLFLLIYLFLDGSLRLFTLDETQLYLMYSLICIAVPVNIILFGSIQERGIFSQWGLMKLLIIMGQLLIADWLVNGIPAEMTSLLDKQLLPWTIDGIASLSLLVMGVGILFCLIKLRLSGFSFYATAVGMLLSLTWLIYCRGNNFAPALSISSMGLLMIVFIIQDVYRMAYLDELTGIPGRRALHEDLMKLNGNYVIAMADIDFFKKFNDTYGHDTGDQLLRMVASKLNQNTGGGKAYRYGGEEFVIIFPAQKLADVLPHLEKVRQHIAQTGFALRGKDRPKKKPRNPRPAQQVKRVSVTVSIGAAEKSPGCKNPREVLAAADKALYRAKNSGRNRVCKG